MQKFILAILLSITAPIFSGAQITMEKDKQGLLLLEKGENVLFYQEEPKNIDGKFERRHYIHPLWGVDGTILTEDFPDDHLHHRGIFWTWHQVWIGDKRIGDPWAIVDFEQDVTEVEFISDKYGKGILNIEVDWLSEQWKPEGKKVPYIRENTIVTVHPKRKNFRRIDFEIQLLALEDNLSIGGSEDNKGYSGFSVRMKLPDDVIFEGVNGEVEPVVTAIESPGYMNVYGSINQNGKKEGIVIIDHPDNPGYPQPWILRKKNSMQNIAFPGRETVKISIEEPLILKYSLMVYSGKFKTKLHKEL